MSLLPEVAVAARACGLAGSRVLVAASGGIDSTLLAHLLAALRSELSLELALGHVHHGLRGADADGDAAFVECLGRKLSAPVAVARVEPGTLREGTSSRLRPTLQEAARTLRYDALARLARDVGADHIATAHTADDQAETLLLRLMRGTGPDGLAGIPPRSPDGRIVRPLLRVSRADVLAEARARGISWREDASNTSPDYARSRLRQHWIPGLAADFNPRLLRVIADLAEAQRRDSEWIEELVADEASRRFTREGDALWIRTEGWDALPEALRRRLARRALVLQGAGRDVTRTHLARFAAFLGNGSRGKRVQFPDNLVLVRLDAGFCLRHDVVGVPPAC